MQQLSCHERLKTLSTIWTFDQKKPYICLVSTMIEMLVHILQTFTQICYCPFFFYFFFPFDSNGAINEHTYMTICLIMTRTHFFLIYEITFNLICV